MEGSQIHLQLLHLQFHRNYHLALSGDIAPENERSKAIVLKVKIQHQSICSALVEQKMLFFVIHRIFAKSISLCLTTVSYLMIE